MRACTLPLILIALVACKPAEQDRLTLTPKKQSVPTNNDSTVKTNVPSDKAVTTPATPVPVVTPTPNIPVKTEPLPTTPAKVEVIAPTPTLMCNPYDLMPKTPTFTLTSTSVKTGEALPVPQMSGVFGAGGKDESPQLSWSGFPAATKSFVVTMYDPDMLFSPSGFWHWALINIPATTTSLAANVGALNSTTLPRGSVQIKNDASMARYVGAAPAKGSGRHRYQIVVYAVDVESLSAPSLAMKATADSSPAFMAYVLSSHVLAKAILTPFAEIK